jgi:multiple sugar transport system permease protein
MGVDKTSQLRPRKRVDYWRIWHTSFAIICLVLLLAPVFWIGLSGLKTRSQIFAYPPLIIFQPTLANLIKMVTKTSVPRHLLNSFIAAGASTVISVILGTMAAYAVSRTKVGGSRFMFWALNVRMLPPVVLAIPLFIAFASLRLIDTYIALPIMYLIYNIPLAIWMMKSFIDELPAELEESAYIDGAGVIQVLRFIVLPLITPGLVATAVIAFIFSWNEYVFALLFTRINARTIPVDLAGFIQIQAEVDWGLITATATLAILPPIILAIIFQKYIVRGLTMGAVK